MTLPNFLMIGAQKSGTTAIYAYIAQHPQVFTSENKEPGFFAFEGQPAAFTGPDDARGERYRVRDIERYRELFRAAGAQPRRGEASNVHLYVPQAADRIRHYVPEAKLIAVLRDPVDRAYSAYRHLVRDGREDLSFEDALAAEPRRIAANWHPHWHYLARGFYHAQLARFYERFDPRQIAVYTYDDFRRDPAGMLRSVFTFLEIDPDFLPDMSVRHNVSGVPRFRLLHGLVARPSAAKDLVKRLIPTGARQRIRSALMDRNIVAGEPR
ncbi:MAG TPA: sulfotransferase, partial [Gemmatimonadales bacterium]|nr:sulfotransferase [Gemmatimonadales bacterium]